MFYPSLKFVSVNQSYILLIIDESILEKCKGGTITASFRLAHNPRQEGSSRQENLYSNIQIGFEVVNFQNQQFTVKIISVR